MKSFLIGLFLASPAAFFWAGWPHPPEAKRSVSAPVLSPQTAGSVRTVPVEVIAAGSAPQWIQVQVGQ
ncbi:MAG: hypothetical protein ACRCXD_06740 [Luteolibacter sp.]